MRVLLCPNLVVGDGQSPLDENGISKRVPILVELGEIPNGVSGTEVHDIGHDLVWDMDWLLDGLDFICLIRIGTLGTLNPVADGVFVLGFGAGVGVGFGVGVRHHLDLHLPFKVPEENVMTAFFISRSESRLIILLGCSEVWRGSGGTSSARLFV